MRFGGTFISISGKYVKTGEKSNNVEVKLDTIYYTIGNNSEMKILLNSEKETEVINSLNDYRNFYL